jgi:hypothetical protein
MLPRLCFCGEETLDFLLGLMAADFLAGEFLETASSFLTEFGLPSGFVGLCSTSFLRNACES